MTENQNTEKGQVIIFYLACMGAIGGAIWSGTESDHPGRSIQYLFKPLATGMLVYWCFKAYQSQVNRLTKFVVVGMLLSLVGDVLLMVPADLFIFGLLAFLAAHIAYLYALTSDTRLFQSKTGLLLYVIIGGSVYALLWPSLNGVLKIAVAAYVIVLTSMASQLFARWRHIGGRSAGLGAAGGFLFVLSDGALAVNKFLSPLPLSALIVLATYWAAQYLILRSVKNTQ